MLLPIDMSASCTIATNDIMERIPYSVHKHMAGFDDGVYFDASRFAMMRSVVYQCTLYNSRINEERLAGVGA